MMMMMMMMKKFKLQILIILIFIFLALHEKSFSLARPVNKVATKREMAVRGDTSDCFSLTKEIIHPIERIGGRKLRGEEEEARKGKKVGHFVGKRKGSDEEINFMAFASDYHPPKPHPPKNN